MQDWERDSIVVPVLAARSWSMLMQFVDDLMDGVDVDVEFCADVFGQSLEVSMPLVGLAVSDSGELVARVMDRDTGDVLLVPFSGVTGVEVR